MSIQVNSFDVYKAEEILKTCPQIIKTYVKLLKEQTEKWKDLHYISMKKLKEANESINQLLLP